MLRRKERLDRRYSLGRFVPCIRDFPAVGKIYSVCFSSYVLPGWWEPLPCSVQPVFGTGRDG